MERQRKTQKPPKKVVNTDKNKKSAKKSRLKSSSECSKGGFYYSFLTVILLLCLVQITISAVLNISKIISYKAKIIQITNTKNAAQALNDQLHDSINNFSNVAGLEAIARNNLKMSSDDEVMVIINTPKTDTAKEKSKKNGIFGD
ncbi:MAG: septum formation initiator family protein [bacterium]|nr:septum formation initiator family protein [bacterium]